MPEKKVLLAAFVGGIGAVTVPIVMDMMHSEAIHGGLAYAFIFVAAALNFITGYQAGTRGLK